MTSTDIEPSELTKWDPSLTERVMGIIRPFLRRYFRSEVRGLENVPAGGALATGITDAGGKFTLRTFAEGDGAVPGTHRVTIAKNVAEPTTADNPYALGKNVLPSRYARLDESGLQLEVRSGETNHFRLELAD